jgi:hypothetical protein
MGFLNRLVLVSSLVVAAPVLAETLGAAEGGVEWERVRESLISECGDPDFLDSVDQWSVLSCWERTVQELTDSGDLAHAFFIEIEVRRAFLEGIREGEAICERKDDSGFDDDEGDGEDGGYYSAAEDDIDLVTVCHRSGKKKRGDAVTIEVPADVADRLIELGDYEGRCSADDEQDLGARASLAKRGGSKKTSGGQVAARENKSNAKKIKKNSGEKKKQVNRRSSNKKNQKRKKIKKGAVKSRER